METFFEIMGPTISVLLAILIPALIGLVVKGFRKLGIDIEARHREALQSALENAAKLSLAKAGLGGGIVARDAVDYVKQSVPDAVAAFGLDDQRIRDLIKPKVV